MRHRYIVTILALFFGLVSVFGKPVTLNEVRDAVSALMQSFGKDLDIEGIDARYLPGGELAYYMVDLGESGWVMVSGDDAMRPVLAFSFENSMTPEEEWNDAAAYLLDIYQDEISFTLQDASLPRDARWDQAALPTDKKAAAVGEVEPFIDVNWNQSSGWNRFCPEDEEGPGGHVYVGCVAVSMAQAMSVYEYPVMPQGVKSYVHEDYGSIAVNYDQADPYEWGQMSSTTSDDYNAILLYHCAVSVEMDFGADGSGAWVKRNALPAMKEYFSYSQSMTFEERYTDDEEWEAALANELEAGRPIIYRGNPSDGTAGHAWNLDGYDIISDVYYFHMNFGWSGSQNGYYTLNAINPGSNDFNSSQGAILGIALPSSAPYDISLSKTAVEEELPVGSFVADVDVSDEDPDNVYTFTCEGEYSIILDDYGPASFYINDRKLYTDKVFEYDDENPEKNTEFLLITVEDQHGNEYSEEFNIDIEKVFVGPTGLALSDSSVNEEKIPGTPVGKLIVEDEDPLNTYTYTLQGPFNPATEEYDPPSFYIENDTLKTSVEFDYNLSDTCYILISLEDSRGFTLSRGFTINIIENQSGTTGIREFKKDISIYPNPADQYVNIEGVEGFQSVEMWELSGKLAQKFSAQRDRLDVSGLKTGIYLLVLDGSEGRVVRKILIQR